MSADRWIEAECPVTGVDWDHEPMVGPDTVVICTHCGGEHRIGDVAHVLERTSDDGMSVAQLTELEWRAIASAPQS